MIKFLSILIVFLHFISPLNTFAKNSEGHNEDLLYIIYGYKDYNTFEEKVSESEKLSYWIVSDAAAFAIDEQGMGKTKNKYQSLQDNLKSTTKGKSLILPPYLDFPNTGGGQHRAYNHQGFYWDYRDDYDENGENKYLDRWILGRDKILIPSVAAAFNLDLNSPEAEVISVISYYCHIIGDLLEGKTNQMRIISKYYFMIQQLESDLEDAINRVGGSVYLYFNEIKMDNVFRHAKFSVRSCRTRETAFESAKKFMRKEMPIIIEKIIGKSISDLQITNKG